MRRDLIKIIGSVLLAGIMTPVGVLLAAGTPHQPDTMSRTAVLHKPKKQRNLLNQIQALAARTTKDVAPLQVQEEETPWEEQDGMLIRASNDIDAINKNLARLDQIKTGLDPWQQTVVRKATREAHEMAYQMDVALAKLAAHEDPTYLSVSTYPQNIDAICRNANRMEWKHPDGHSIRHAESKMAALRMKKVRDQFVTLRVCLCCRGLASCKALALSGTSTKLRMAG